jgi:hypothetical protein
MSANQKDERYQFSMREFPSIWALLPITLAAPSMALVVLPFVNELVAIAIGILSASGILSAVLLNSPVIRVSGGDDPMLLVGRATIPLRFIELVEVLNSDQIKIEKGPQLNANAYFVNQAGSKSFVKVTLNDKTDTTPYWLFACRKPADLVVALRANRETLLFS